MRRSGVIVVLPVLMLLVACSGSTKKGASDQTTSTTAATPQTDSSSSTSVPSSSSTSATAPSSSTTTSHPTTSLPTTTSLPLNSDGPTAILRGISYSPHTLINCNAPTMIELGWTSVNATRVELHIDGGGVFAHYPNGKTDTLVPVPCDSKTHTYTIAAVAADGTTSRSIIVRTNRTA